MQAHATVRSPAALPPKEPCASEGFPIHPHAKEGSRAHATVSWRRWGRLCSRKTWAVCLELHMGARPAALGLFSSPTQGGKKRQELETEEHFCVFTATDEETAAEGIFGSQSRKGPKKQPPPNRKESELTGQTGLANILQEQAARKHIATPQARKACLHPSFNQGSCNEMPTIPCLPKAQPKLDRGPESFPGSSVSKVLRSLS